MAAFWVLRRVRRLELKNHHQGLVFAEMLIGKTVGLDFKGLFDCEIKRTDIFYVGEITHIMI